MKKISRPKSLKYYILLPLILIILFQASVLLYLATPPGI